MQNKDYLLPGIAALVLAVIFPLYWFNEIWFGSADRTDALLANITSLNLSDAVFLAIGLLSIYVSLSLRNILNEQLNFKKIDLLLMLLISVHVIFLATLGLDVAAAVLSEQTVLQYQDTFIGIGLTAAVASMVLFGLLDILIGAVLLKNSENLPTLLKIFALVTLIQGVLEISAIMSFASLLSFPVSLIILAVYFLRKPESLEVV